VRAPTLSLAAALLAVAVGSAGSTATTPAGRLAGTDDRDLTAAAHPGRADPRVRDVAVDDATSWHRGRVKADTSATASATCDGCRGSAHTLQVLYLPRPASTHVDNAAVAWSRCTSCRAGAVSVQVVVLREAGPLTADNRAFAAAAGCRRCDTSAAAYQLVVVAPPEARLSGAEVAQLRTWALDPGTLGQAPRSARTAAASGPARTLERLVTDDLGGRTLLADVDAR
jgi:hypothetical protein